MAASNRVFTVEEGQKPSLNQIAERIKQGKVKNCIVLCGAGISTSSGIPDFRSPKTGLYSNLQSYNLPYPEAVFDISYFLETPEPFYTLSKTLYPGNFKPTLTHCFFKLLQDKKILKRLYTQNVDTLEAIAGVSEDLIVTAHGSFATARCLNCRKQFSADQVKAEMLTGKVVKCKEAGCKGKSRAYIKPDIVFFGESLPARFFQCSSKDFTDCDLLITLGTSLKVHPFAGLIDRPPDDCPRLLINLELVGEADEYFAGSGMFGRYREEGFDFDGKSRGGSSFTRDVAYIGECDKAVRELAALCGFGKDLDKIYNDMMDRLKDNNTDDKAVTVSTPTNVEPAPAPVQEKEEEEEEKEEMEALAKRVDKNLHTKD